MPDKTPYLIIKEFEKLKQRKKRKLEEKLNTLNAEIEKLYKKARAIRDTIDRL
jgi:uncharacterized protein YlxW (UPF0749 family)